MKSQKQRLILIGGVIIPIMFLASGCGDGPKVASDDAAPVSSASGVAKGAAASDNVIIYAVKEKVQKTNDKAPEKQKAVEAMKAEEAENKKAKEVEDDQDFPLFPWPPSESSKTVEIPITFFKNDPSKPTYLRDVDIKLRNAMSESGYDDRRSYFRVPDGFALVTQLEHIKRDGTPRKSNRWGESASETLDSFTWGEYFNALFKPNPGYYRTIAFIVTSKSFSRRDKPVTVDETKDWLQEGKNRLPSSVAKYKFTNDHDITALIYEFKKIESKNLETTRLNINAKTHLEKSNLWSKLRS